MKRKRERSNGAPVIVPCPAGVQKRMRRNLVFAARSKIASSRRKRAEEILAAIGKEASVPAHSPPPVTQIAAVDTARTTVEVAKRTRDASGMGAVGIGGLSSVYFANAPASRSSLD